MKSSSTDVTLRKKYLIASMSTLDSKRMVKNKNFSSGIMENNMKYLLGTIFKSHKFNPGDIITEENGNVKFIGELKEECPNEGLRWLLKRNALLVTPKGNKISEINRLGHRTRIATEEEKKLYLESE